MISLSIVIIIALRPILGSHWRLDSRWREIGEQSKIEAKMFEKAQFTWGK